jgi:hypothetical protein
MNIHSACLNMRIDMVNVAYESYDYLEGRRPDSVYDSVNENAFIGDIYWTRFP